ncbi:MAG: hypothetical protein WAP35_08390 [Solirubrobacterales bacterium]
MARVSRTAKAYMRSTPIRPTRRDRAVVDYFGRRHVDPHDLDHIGYKPKRNGSHSD